MLTICTLHLQRPHLAYTATGLLILCTREILFLIHKQSHGQSNLSTCICISGRNVIHSVCLCVILPGRRPLTLSRSFSLHQDRKSINRREAIAALAASSQGIFHIILITATTSKTKWWVEFFLFFGSLSHFFGEICEPTGGRMKREEYGNYLERNIKKTLNETWL